MRTNGMPLLLAALAVVGCGGKKDDARPQAVDPGSATAGSSARAEGSASPEAGSGSGSGSPDGAVAVPSAVDPAAVQALVDAWLSAQNGGDFAAYSALYAEKFAGIKRVGARTWVFDRAGWIADRRRMFKAPMTVAATDVVIHGTAPVASVDFVQSYTQGAFHDEGPKHLTVVKTPDGYRIAREEMLRSIPATPTEAPVFHVHSIAGTPRFFVDVADDLTGRGPLGNVITETDFLYVIADAGKTGAGSAWLGKPIKVLDASGAFCEQRVTKVELVSGGYPHFGVFEGWKGDPAEGLAPATEAQKSAHIWEMRPPYLAVQVDAGACTSPVLGLPVTAQAHPFPRTTSTEHHDAVLAAFRAMPEWKAQQKEYVGQYEGQGDWEKAAKAVTFTDGMRTFVVVHAQAGNGCGEFYGSLSALFELRGPEPKPVRVGGTASDLVPTAVILIAGQEHVYVVVQDADLDSPAAVLAWGADPVEEVGEPLTFPVHDGC